MSKNQNNQQQRITELEKAMDDIIAELSADGVYVYHIKRALEIAKAALDGKGDQ